MGPFEFPPFVFVFITIICVFLHIFYIARKYGKPCILCYIHLEQQIKLKAPKVYQKKSDVLFFYDVQYELSGFSLLFVLFSSYLYTYIHQFIAYIYAGLYLLT